MNSIKNLGNPLILVALSTLLMIQFFAPYTYSIQFVSATKTIIVPDDYSTIGDAITNSVKGDVVLVRNGEYRENLLVDKEITLTSESAGGALIVGEGEVARGGRAVFTLVTDGITISGFAVRSENYSNTGLSATGITVAADNCIIDGNDISGTYYGVFSAYTSSTKIINNNVTFVIKDGLRICGGSQNLIENNSIDNNTVSGIAIEGWSDKILRNSLCDNGRGIGLGASYSVFFNNNVTGNIGSGIYLAGSNNIILSNVAAENDYGVYITSFFAAPNNNSIYGNNFVNNNHSVYAVSALNREDWDNGLRGNYWSDYEGDDEDGDGYGDIPYLVYGDNTDRKPLTNPSILQDAQPSLPDTGEFKGTVAHWSFEKVESNGVTPDSLGFNPVIVEMTDGKLVSPSLVEGVTGNALRFNGSDYAYVSSSPTLNISGEFTIDAWVNLRDYKDIEYNVIIEECMRTTESFPTRISGLAINGLPPKNNDMPALGALRGFFLDEKGVFNEIVTTQEVVPLGEWTHVVFVRSYNLGMRLYINGVECPVKVTTGTQNPNSLVAGGSEFYIGHDSLSTIDDLVISTLANQQPSTSPTPNKTEQPKQDLSLLQEWWFWTIIVAAILTAGAFFFVRRSNRAN